MKRFRPEVSFYEAVEKNDSTKVAEYLDLGVDPNEGPKAEPGQTLPLIVAVLNNSNSVLRELVKKGADPTRVCNRSGLYPLWYAVNCGRLETVDALLTCGADIEVASSNTDTTPLLVAIMNRDLKMVEFLLDKGANPNSPTKRSPLVTAIEVESFKIVDALLSKGANPIQINEYGFAPLHQVAKKGTNVMIKSLVASGAIVDQLSFDGSSALFVAVSNDNYLAASQLLWCGANPELSHLRGYAPLHYAADHGNKYMVDLLLDFKADPNAEQETTRATPLFMAAVEGHTCIVRRLLDRGADVNKVDWANETPICAAARYGHIDAVELLLKKGANPNTSDKDGGTALYYAAGGGFCEVVKTLLKENVDPNKALTDDGSTPLIIAAQEGHLATVKVLLEKKADVNKTRTDDFASPLYMAVCKNHFDVVRVLVDAGAKLEQATTDYDKTTPLGQAVLSNYLEIAGFLLERGANVNALDSDQDIILIYAVHDNNVEMVRQLLKWGAYVNFSPSDGNTALHIAGANGNMEMIEDLLQAGAAVDMMNKHGFTPADYAVVFGHHNVKACIDLHFEVRKKAMNGDYAFFQEKIEAGELPPLPLLWVKMFPVYARQKFHDWVRQSYKAQKAVEAALFNDTANEEAAMMSEVEGPPQEALGEMCVYPLAATRAHLRKMRSILMMMTMMDAL